MSLLTTLSETPQAFLQPTQEISLEAVALVKSLLDPLASDVANAQKARRDSGRTKRKRDEEEQQVLHLRTVYTNGLAVKQIWEQARRVLDAACDEVERSLPAEKLPQLNGVVRDDSDAEEMDHLSDLDVVEMSDGTGELEEDGQDMLPQEASLLEEDDEEEMEDELSEENIEDDEEHAEDLLEEDVEVQEIFQPDPNGLNDGFFSIDDFNRQSQFMEQMDARGDDDNPSDEDEVDWEADPLSMSATKPEHNSNINGTNAEHEDEEDGPTFGNADLGAPDSDEEVDEEEGYLDDGVPGLSNTNDILYADFFEPPPKKPSKTKRMRALPKTQPPTVNAQGDQRRQGFDADVERAMQDVNRDIFASESELSTSDDDPETGPSTKNLSTHEKQRAKIAAEIRRLEAASIAKRDWTLSGEARAADRPLNSLIEEDLEFERVGKPVPVITAEVTEEIEQLIKRRILAREFDEVIRRHPDAIGSASEIRRGRAEVDDTKPQTGLGELYEQDHLRATDPGYVDKRSAATKKQHEEISRLWKDVSYQLDLLSNLHFKPKRLDMEIKTTEDKPKISMEDARPVGEGIGVEESMLAPQEVYKAGDARKDGEVSRKGGANVSKEEMSREEKLRKRRREKERAKKGKSNAAEVKTLGKPVRKGKKEDKQGILDELRKGNVKVIDKKGELRNLGKESQTREVSSSALKL